MLLSHSGDNMGKGVWTTGCFAAKAFVLGLGAHCARMKVFFARINWASFCFSLVVLLLVSFFSAWKLLALVVATYLLVHNFVFVEPWLELRERVEAFFFLDVKFGSVSSSSPGSPMAVIRRTLTSLVLNILFCEPISANKKRQCRDACECRRQSSQVSSDNLGEQPFTSLNGSANPGFGTSALQKRDRSNSSSGSLAREKTSLWTPRRTLSIDTDSGRDSPGYGFYVSGSPEPISLIRTSVSKGASPSFFPPCPDLRSDINAVNGCSGSRLGTSTGTLSVIEEEDLATSPRSLPSPKSA